MVETAMELRQRQNKILFVVDGHIHVDDAENREDLALEVNSPTNLAARKILCSFLKTRKLIGDLTYNQNSLLLLVIEEIHGSKPKRH